MATESDELNIYVLWTLRITLLLLLVLSPFARRSVTLSLDNAIIRFLLVIAIVLLIFVDPISAIIFVVTFIIIFMLSRKKSVQFNELPSVNEFMEDVADGDENNEETFKSTDGYTSSAFTTPFQFHDVQNNLVGDETVQNTEVRTWDNELGPQGMGEVKGYNFFN